MKSLSTNQVVLGLALFILWSLTQFPVVAQNQQSWNYGANLQGIDWTLWASSGMINATSPIGPIPSGCTQIPPGATGVLTGLFSLASIYPNDQHFTAIPPCGLVFGYPYPVLKISGDNNIFNSIPNFPINLPGSNSYFESSTIALNATAYFTGGDNYSVTGGGSSMVYPGSGFVRSSFDGTKNIVLLNFASGTGTFGGYVTFTSTAQNSGNKVVLNGANDWVVPAQPLPNQIVISNPHLGAQVSVAGSPTLTFQTVLPQSAQGQGNSTTTTLVNPSASIPANISNWTPPLNRPFRDAPVAFTVSPFGLIQLPPGGTTPQGLRASKSSATAADALIQNAIVLESNVPLGAVAEFNVANLGIAGVGEGLILDSFMTLVDLDLNLNKFPGVAVYNAGMSTNLDVSLSGLDGVPVATAQVPIATNGQTAFFFHQKFPGVNKVLGTAIVTGYSPIAGTALQLGSQAGQFTSLPVIPVSPLPPSETLYFAQFGNGGNNFSSTIFLGNPSSTGRAKGSLSFFADDGSALSVAVNGAAPASSIPFDIAPLGGAVFATDGLGTRQAGSARAILTQGVIGGVLQFSLPPLGLAGVGASQPVDGFIIPASRSLTADTNTGVAIASVQKAVSLVLTLRDAKGQTVSQQTASLPANGHLAEFINELFPTVNTDEFLGTMTVTATGDQIAASALRLGSSPGSFTTMPITRIRN